MTPVRKKAFSSDDQKLGLERIVFFSDAVMAIAITLLAIDLKLPATNGGLTAPGLLARLNAVNPHLISFFVSFSVVGISMDLASPVF